MAIDAAGHIWVANCGTRCFFSVSDSSSVAELTSSGGLAGSFDPSGANFDGAYRVAIDPAGNVWVTNHVNRNVAELIGMARPVLTPLVACLKRTPPSAVCLP